MSGKRVLVVDDELHITEILAFKLEPLGFEVTTANDGEEAYRYALQGQPHLILTDFQMPLMDGYELAVQLKRNLVTQMIPLLMLTAQGHKLTPSELSITNIQGLIPKPFSAREVIGRVEEIIGSANADDFPIASVA